ncbi:AI-2E family transporter [Patescibacteria group bacterium]
MPRKIEISHRTIIFIFVLVAGIWFFIQIRDILFLLFISFLLMTAIRPMVDSLERLKIPRIISILLIYLFFVGLIGVVFASAIPTLVYQSNRLFTELPGLTAQIVPFLNGDSTITQQIAPISANILRATLNVFNNALSTTMILVITFYLLTGRRDIEKFLNETMGKTAANRIIEVIKQVEKRLSNWVSAQLLLMVIVGVMVYIGLLILKVEYALPLAIIAGLLEILPNIGPILSAVPAMLVAFTISPFLALLVGLLYFIVQQIENSVIVPQIMKQSVGFSPILTIVSLLIGAKLAGVTGAILAIPIMITLQVVVSYFLFDIEDNGKEDHHKK